MDTVTKKKVLARLRRIQGQVAGISRMVEADQYCVDILLQIAAAQAALGQAGKLVLGQHIENCVTEALQSGHERERRHKIEELMEVFTRYGKLER